jgi:hypothetical protein
VAGGVAAASLSLPLRLRAAAFELPQTTRDALGRSPLVYVSPLRSDGSESTCHGEVWFVRDGADVVVVTASERWKAKSVAAGLQRARLWVGDYGVWTRSEGKFREGPTFEATASFEKGAAARARVLASYGEKYPDEWDKWGPRFRKGLADGSRVMIRYVPSGR